MIKTCNKHGEYKSTEGKLFNKTIWSSCPQCIGDYEKKVDNKLSEDELRITKEKLKRIYEIASIPERFKDCSFENFIAEDRKRIQSLSVCKSYYDNFYDIKNTGSSLFLCGNFGTGKTHLAIAILNELIKSETGSGKYTTTLRMIRDIRSSYRGGKYSEQEIIDRYVNYPLLILDEIGVQFGTEGEKILLFEVINGRYENYKPSILISNLSIKGIENYLGERAIDRLKSKSGSLVVMDWESFRNKGA